MHELGVLRHVVTTVARSAKENNIGEIKHITLEVGYESTYLAEYLEKLFPVALRFCPEIGKPELKLIYVEGNKLQIKEYGY
ncbi:MAG: hydrogenase/urease maturation nickel metallochaperone HypA [Bacillota bacterium]|nr:hydrogenase/urease maturation nickel metallochaperone HypA [Bacillota bacterium]